MRLRSQSAPEHSVTVSICLTSGNTARALLPDDGLVWLPPYVATRQSLSERMCEV